MRQSRRYPCVAFFGVVVLLASAQIARAQTISEQFEGIVQVVWGDPHPESNFGGTITYSLATPDGRVLPLELPDPSLLSTADFGKRVTLSGRRAQTVSGVTGDSAAETVVVEAVPQRFAPQADFSSQAATGTRRVLYLLVKFSDDAGVPHPPSFYTALNNPMTPPVGQPFPTTVNGFFSKTSWNQLFWQGDVAGVGGIGAPGGWLTLPRTKSFYAPCGVGSACANLNALSVDAINLAKAQGISFTSYDNINFVLSNDLDCCAWGGSYALDGKSYGATWEPPWGQEAGTYSHELGHSLGLPHSGWKYYAYDSPWDVMSARASASSVLCGSYFSRNYGVQRNLLCTEPGNGYIAAHKEVLGWIPPANVATTMPSATGQWTLDGESLPLGSAMKILKICLPGAACSGAGAHYITVEARVKALGTSSQFDNAIPNEGILIQDVLIGRPSISGGCYFNGQSGWAMPIDATPGDYNSTTCTFYPGTALYNAHWSPGQTYSNATYGFDVSVVSRAGSSFVVTVSPTGMTLPAAFAKTSPASGATGQPAPVTVAWGSSSGVTRFEYCYDTTNDNACSHWVAGGLGTSAVLADVAPGATYYWQVRAVNSKGTTYADGSATTFRSFTTAFGPGNFMKASPADGATWQPGSGTNGSLLSSAPPSLAWTLSSGATNYQLCYDTTNNNVCDAAWTTVGASQSAAAMNLVVGATYYWQVRATNTVGTTMANGGTWWSFTVPFVATVTTNPPGAAVTVDGVSYVTPSTFNWAIGSQHVIGTAQRQARGGTQLRFVSWSDGGALSHTVTVSSIAAIYVATFAEVAMQVRTPLDPSDTSIGGDSPIAVVPPADLHTAAPRPIAVVPEPSVPAPTARAVAAQISSQPESRPVPPAAAPSVTSAVDSREPAPSLVLPRVTAGDPVIPSAEAPPSVPERRVPLALAPLTRQLTAAAQRTSSQVRSTAILRSHSGPAGPSSARSDVETRAHSESGVVAAGTGSPIVEWTTRLVLEGTEARLRFTPQLSTRALFIEVRTRSGGFDWRTETLLVAADTEGPMSVDLHGLSGAVLDVQFVLHGLERGDEGKPSQWRIADLRLEKLR